jgi:hypothetical protein
LERQSDENNVTNIIKEKSNKKLKNPICIEPKEKIMKTIIDMEKKELLFMSCG